MRIWDKKEEGEALRKRFDDLKKNKGISRASFARDYGVKGGDSMINQHITGHRPMNMDAAVAYARGFGCELWEISPRLAMEAKESASVLGLENRVEENRSTHIVAQPGDPIPLPRYATEIDTIVGLLKTMDERGLAIMLHQAKMVAAEYPAVRKTLKSSA